MRSAGWIIAALVAGFLLGGVQPRRQLSALESDIKDLEVQLEDARRKADRASRPRTFSIPGMGDLYDSSAEEPDGDEREGGRRRAGSADGGEVVVVDTGRPSDRPPSADQIPAAELDAAVEAQRLRAAQSRAALIEQLELSDADVDEFDAIIHDMNDRFAEIADEVVELALSGQEPAPVDMMAMTHEVTGILLDAQEGMDDLAGADADALDQSTSAAWNYVDLGSFRDATLDLGEQLGE